MKKYQNYIDNKTIFGYPQKVRRNWLRVILDDSLDDNKIIELIDKSYEISNK
jgi:predicted DNA-binding protein (MmcQ/YjbR family)